MAATVENLREILFNVEPPKQLIDRKTEIVLTSEDALEILKTPSRETAKKFCQILFDEMEPVADEVYPSLFIGNYKSILSVDYLKSKGITHVLNVGELDPTGVVPKIDPATLPGIQYQKLDISDWASSSDHEPQIKAFKEAADIIDSIMIEDNVKLVVNCMAGISRSSTSVATYLILKQGMTAQEALTMMKKGRDIWPSNPNLNLLAKMSNEKHGYSNVEEKDFGDLPLRAFMKKASKS